MTVKLGYRPNTDSESSSDDNGPDSDDNELDYAYRKYKCRPKSLKRVKFRERSAEKEDEQLFNHEVSLGLGLLKSCRQIYHEAMSIFYSENTFVVSRVRYRYNRIAAEGCQGSRCHDYHQVLYTPIWLATLGAKIKLLRKVVIDISAVCDHPHAYGDDFPSLLPFLRHVLNGHLSRCNITFAHTGRTTGSGPSAKTPQMIRATATRLNRGLMAFTRDDTLISRCLSTSRSFLTSKSMGSNGIDGSVQYYTRPQSVFREFEIDQTLGAMRWTAAKPVTSITDLPMQVQNIICHHAITLEQSLRLSMDRENPLSFDRSIFDVSKRFRECFTRAVGTYVPVIIELTAREVDANYGDLGTLRRFYPKIENSHHNGLISQIIKASLKIRSRPIRATILVRVLLTRPTRPKDVRININDLFYLCQLRGFRTVNDDDTYRGSRTINNEVCLAIELKYAGGDKVHCETSYTMIGQLKTKMFLYFTDVLDQLSKDENAGLNRPKLWIDGLANFVDAVLPPMGCRFTQANSMKFEAGGRKIKSVMKDIVRRHHINYLECCLYSQDRCVYHTWKSLRPWAKSVWMKECLRRD